MPFAADATGAPIARPEDELPVSQRGPRRPARPPNRLPPFSRGPGDRHVLLVAAGLAIFLATLWFGVVVIGDGPARSALMAGVIVALSAAGYLTARRDARNRR